MGNVKEPMERKLPSHIVIVMDGNGRWARKQRLPRVAGHRAGVSALREIVKFAAKKGIEALTVYAFSSENWKRPDTEVMRLMDLFMTALKQEVDELHANNVQLRFIGELSAFSKKLRTTIQRAEQKTEANTGLNLVVAANYGGRWDITHAVKTLINKIQNNELDPVKVDESVLNSLMSLSDLPAPELFIRTGGEQRISNYLLWQIAYTELYFTDCLWPDFGPDEFEDALDWFTGRERRFGQTSEQIKKTHHA